MYARDLKKVFKGNPTGTSFGFPHSEEYKLGRSLPLGSIDYHMFHFDRPALLIKWIYAYSLTDRKDSPNLNYISQLQRLPSSQSNWRGSTAHLIDLIYSREYIYLHGKFYVEHIPVHRVRFHEYGEALLTEKFSWVRSARQKWHKGLFLPFSRGMVK